MATKSSSRSAKGKSKVHKVMKEHKEGKLKSGSGKKVKSRKQAVAMRSTKRENPAQMCRRRKDLKCPVSRQNRLRAASACGCANSVLSPAPERLNPKVN